MRNSKFSSLGRNALLALGSFALFGCDEPPAEEVVPPKGIQSGIWLLADSAHPPNASYDPCRPMLMRVKVTTESVTFERRVFPCYSQIYSFDHIAFERDGETLRIGNQDMGTISERKLEVNLPYAAGSISWDLDREYETYRENSTNGLFVAYPKLQPDSSPVPSRLSYHGKEMLPLVGRLHAARLPETSLRYGLEDTLAHGKIVAFDDSAGLFRLEPEKGFVGFDSFTYWPIVDEVKFPGETVDIQIGGKAEAPQSMDLDVIASEDFPATFNPDILNPDSLEYEIEIIDPPLHGAAVLKISDLGTPYFAYAPDLEYNGPDIFTYRAYSGDIVGNTAAVKIDVVPVDDPPTASDLNIQIDSNDATPIQLPVSDIDSSELGFVLIDEPLHGQIYGDLNNLVYVPDPNFPSGNDSFVYRVADFSSHSSPGLVNITISPGSHPSQIVDLNVFSGVSPVWSDSSNVYYRASQGGSATIAMTGFGFTSQVLQEREPDTLGFDAAEGSSRRTTFFSLDSHLYFTTATLTKAVRFYRATGLSSENRCEIPAPSNDIISEPSVGEAYIEGNNAYLPIYWQNADSSHTCQVWKVGESTLQPELIHTFAPTKTPCFGLKSFGPAQYMFVGSNLVQFAGMASQPAFLKDLGNSEPLPWLVEAGGKLFFQTRTLVQGNTRVDLWVTDGTTAGTQIVKEIETTFAHFDIFSPLAFSDKLYFAHKKSLWSSDGTAAGTKIVTTIPVAIAIGDGAIGAISAIGGKLYFLATSDVAGREPWISDGTSAGTSLLRDLRPGAMGSSVPSSNPAYFHDWNGKIYFLADDGADAFGLWTTDGTSNGTQLLKKRAITTIVGFYMNKMVYHNQKNIFAMTLE